MWKGHCDTVLMQPLPVIETKCHISQNWMFVLRILSRGKDEKPTERDGSNSPSWTAFISMQNFLFIIIIIVIIIIIISVTHTLWFPLVLLCSQNTGKRHHPLCVCVCAFTGASCRKPFNPSRYENHSWHLLSPSAGTWARPADNGAELSMHGQI